MLSLRDIFGPTGRLVEILSKEDQSLVLEVNFKIKFVTKKSKMFDQIIRNAETQHGYGTQYWWTGLRDPEDDHIWIWTGSKNHFKTYIFSQSYYYS